MELKTLCLLVIVGVLSAETKILKTKLLRKMPQVNDKLLRGVPQVNRKRLRGMPQVNKEDATTRVVTSYERFVNFYRYKASNLSSSVATPSIKTCIAASPAPTSITIGVYALRAARGTKFLRHRVSHNCVDDCFEKHRYEDFAVKTFESCADAVESSGWANSFSFNDDKCVGHAAWMDSRHTQGSKCDGDIIFFVAENKINNSTQYPAPSVRVLKTLSRIAIKITVNDFCLSTAKVEVTTVKGTKTFDSILTDFDYLFEQFNIDLCSSNPPEKSKIANITYYDYNGKVLRKETVQKLGPVAPGTMHRVSGSYGELCLHQFDNMAKSSDYPCSSSASIKPFEKTSFMTFAEYRKIIATIPGIPSHFVRATREQSTRLWPGSGQTIEAENFVSGTVPSDSLGECLFANSNQNYLLEASECATARNFVCLDFSALYIY